MSNKKKKYIILSILFLLFTPCLGLLYSYYEARSVIVKEMAFADQDLPESFVGKKIIFVSDIHVNRIRGSSTPYSTSTINITKINSAE